MIRRESGDLLDCSVDVIAHQVNCKGLFGAGLADQIGKRWPACKASYEKFVHDHKKDYLLGRIYVWEGLEKTVVNMFGQDQPGPHTHPKSLYEAVQALKDYMTEEGISTVAMPWKIGCGIGGGDWDDIRQMIERCFDEPEHNLVWVIRD